MDEFHDAPGRSRAGATRHDRLPADLTPLHLSGRTCRARLWHLCGGHQFEFSLLSSVLRDARPSADKA